MNGSDAAARVREVASVTLAIDDAPAAEPARPARAAEPRTAVVSPAVTALVAVIVLLAVSHPVNDPDTWQHLRVGSVLWQTHALPRVNVWTWPTLGAPYDVPSWLFRALLWPFWQTLGIGGLFLWRWITALAVFMLLLVGARAASGRRGTSAAALAVVLWSALLWRERWQCRPETLVSVLLAAEIALLERRRRAGAPHWSRDPAWLLIPLQIFWINAHLSYYLGLVVAGAYAADGLWTRARGRGPDTAPGRLAAIAGLAAVACLANPFGWRALAQPFDFFLHQRGELIFRTVDELRPVDWSRNVWNGLPFYLGFAMLLALERWRRGGFDAAQALLLVALVPQALLSNRFVGLLAVASAPAFARDLDEALARVPGLARRGASRVLSALVLLPVVGLAAADLAHANPPLGGTVWWIRMPVRACDFMLAHDVKGRGYNMYWHGGYLLWRFWPERGRLPFMDIHQTGTRADRDQQILSWNDPVAWNALDRRRRFEWVLLPTRTLSVQGLIARLERDPEWALVFADDAGSLFVRRSGPGSGVARRFEYRDLRLGNANSVELGQRIVADSLFRRRVAVELDRAVADSRYDSRALSLRSIVALSERRWPDAVRDLESALAIDPALAKGHDRLALALVMSGRNREGLEEIRRARQWGTPAPELAPLERRARRLGKSRFGPPAAE